MSPLPLSRQSIAPAPLVMALCAAALLALVLPGGRWSDMVALLASVAAMVAGHDRRERDMLVAAGIAAGLAPVGLLVTPLAIGLAIGRGEARHLPLGGLIALTAWVALPWAPVAPALPNLALLATEAPTTLALVVAIGFGTAMWLGARATTTPASALFVEARLGVTVLAAILPLPLGCLGFVLMLAALPLPAVRPKRAANDNAVARRIVRLAA